MARPLTGEVIIITGASSGIGAATALACARAGMDVVLNARRPERLAAVAAQVAQLGRHAATVAGDAADEHLPDRLLDTAAQRFGRFDVVFANAGYGQHAAMHEMDEADLRRIFEVNFFAANRLLCAAARRLISQQRPGHLLMCSSAVAKFALPTFSAYSATKAAQNHVCRAMRLELRPYGIEVASAHPITTRTEFFDEAARRSSGHTAAPVAPGRGLPRWLIQRPEDVAAAVVRCLRRPRPEVWTSHTVRLFAALVTAFPSLFDALAPLHQRRRP
jgi:NAD(P)-dependent dehydrogenase (short-subunit alcohol dehydrogenase family)